MTLNAILKNESDLNEKHSTVGHKSKLRVESSQLILVEGVEGRNKAIAGRYKRYKGQGA